MPWQQLVADVGGEVDQRGLWAYPLVVVTVQRQAGKTDLDLCQSVQRALQGRTGASGTPPRPARTPAKSGTNWWRTFTIIRTSPLRQFIRGRPLRSNGKEALTFLNGSKLRPHPPTRDALHGKQSDINNIDEAWSFDELRGNELMQAITPTQTTRWRPPYNGAQIWVWSTAGDAQSTWFRKLVERGRRGEPGMAYFEWSIPDDADPFDLDVIAAHHPAYGITVTMDSLRPRGPAGGQAGGVRARLRQRMDRRRGTRHQRESWGRAQTEAPVPEGPTPAFGVAVAADGSAASVVAAVTDDAGRPWLEVLAHRPGRAWVADYMAARMKRWPGAAVAVLRRGPAATVADALDRAGIELLPAGDAEYAAACGDLFDRLCDAEARGEDGPRVVVRAHEGMDLAADTAGKRLVGDGGWVWSRSRSAGDISPLEAGTMATWAAQRPAPAPEEDPDWDFA
jgi:hypothetical protein